MKVRPQHRFAEWHELSTDQNNQKKKLYSIFPPVELWLVLSLGRISALFSVFLGLLGTTQFYFGVRPIFGDSAIMRRRRNFLDPVRDVPSESRQFPVKAVYTYSGLVSGRDLGFISFGSGLSHFQGLRSSFSLRNQDVDITCASNGSLASIRIVFDDLTKSEIKLIPYQKFSDMADGLHLDMRREIVRNRLVRCNLAGYSTFPPIRRDRLYERAKRIEDLFVTAAIAVIGLSLLLSRIISQQSSDLGFRCWGAASLLGVALWTFIYLSRKNIQEASRLEASERNLKLSSSGGCRGVVPLSASINPNGTSVDVNSSEQRPRIRAPRLSGRG